MVFGGKEVLVSLSSFHWFGRLRGALKFVSKCIEKVVASQICNHGQHNNLNEVFQSAYQRYHSTKTALIKVHDDILRSIDSKCSVPDTAAVGPFCSI